MEMAKLSTISGLKPGILIGFGNSPGSNGFGNSPGSVTTRRVSETNTGFLISVKETVHSIFGILKETWKAQKFGGFTQL